MQIPKMFDNFILVKKVCRQVDERLNNILLGYKTVIDNTVQAIGPKVTLVAVGDVILYSVSPISHSFFDGDVQYNVIPQEQLMGVFPKEKKLNKLTPVKIDEDTRETFI